MKANELRIGNYVLDRGKPVSLVGSQLVNIITGKYVDEYQPIRLTEEILLKCDNEFTTDFKLSFKNNRLHILFCEKWLLVCDYLHEYQNAHHTLTGEELTVNL